MSIPRVLSIAGTDPTGGAGIQADLKSIAAAGGYGMAVVTSLVAQNTHGVREVHTPSPDFLRAQLLSVSDDVKIDAVKIGMLADEPSAQVVVDWLDDLDQEIPLVVDPVMVATSGDTLASGVSAELLNRASVITPNLDELAMLTSAEPARTREEADRQAQELADRTGALVLAKGGHLPGGDRGNSLVGSGGVLVHASSPSVHTTASHGTGCSLSSALATRLAAGEGPEAAVRWSTDWVHEALQFGEELQVGSGNGPIDHGHRGRRYAAAARQYPEDFDVPALWSDPAELHGVMVAPAIPAAGPWTEALWRAAGESLVQLDEGFVADLGAGSLPEEQFRFYLAQDNYYLEVYSGALAALAATAPGAHDRRMWAGTVAGTISAETEMQQRWGVPETVRPTPTTRAYTDFLRAETRGEHLTGVAAVLPCFWLYAHVGAGLHERNHDEHPYADWLGTYDDEQFRAATSAAIETTERLLAEATPTQRAEAALAFLRACRHEVDFFAQATFIGEQ